MPTVIAAPAHSPTPWRLVAVPAKTASGDTSFGLVVGPRYVLVNRSEQLCQEDAEFVVRACNNHAKMLSVLELLAKLTPEEGLSPPALHHLKVLAQTAITKATRSLL